MKLLVIIVTYNAMQWAERCFSCLKNSTVCPNSFVVDNGSTDGTQAFINEHYPEVMFHQSEENLGFGKANNMGLQYALDHDYDYVYLLNQDAWVMPDTFEKLIVLSKKYPEYGILSPFQMNEDLFHIDANFANDTCSWRSNHDFLSDIYNNHLSEVYPVSFVMAAHWFMPISTIKKVGGFSPSFPHYGEDGNYIDRVCYNGLKVGIVPNLKVVHDRGWREDSKNKKLHIGYTSNIKRLSNPMCSTLKSFMTVIGFTFKNVIEIGSLRPLLDFLIILFHLGKIQKNKKLSARKECAFLSYNE